MTKQKTTPPLPPPSISEDPYDPTPVEDVLQLLQRVEEQLRLQPRPPKHEEAEIRFIRLQYL